MCTLISTQEVGNKPPEFTDENYLEPFFDFEAMHQKFRAVQAHLWFLRKFLIESDMYNRSKLALMDDYGVKLSELSDWAITLVPNPHNSTADPNSTSADVPSKSSTKPRPKETKHTAKKQKQNNPKSTSGATNPQPQRRSQRIQQKHKNT